MSDIVVTSSASETQMCAEAFAKKLHGGDVVALYGELGSGKTTFVQGLAKGLGVHRRIISPTFIIVRKYESGIRNFYHIDLYRIESERELVGLGIEEVLSDREGIVAIEWAEKLGRLLPKKCWEAQLDHIEENRRRIRIANPDVSS